MTAAFTRTLVRHPPRLRRATVTRTERLAPTLVRVTLAGPELHDFASDGPDDHVKVFFPDPSVGEIVLPQPPGHAPSVGEIITRDYTPRAFRPGTAPTPDTAATPGTPATPPELDLDFVIHHTAEETAAHTTEETAAPTTDETAAPASAWATRARPGDELVIGGPATSRLVPADAQGLVLLADETGLPAVARWLERLPADVSATALLEVGDRSLGGYLPDELRMRANILWLFREHGPGQLAAALRGLGELDGTTYVFGAAEAGALIPLRQHLRKELGLPANQVALSGYWRRPHPPAAD